MWVEEDGDGDTTSQYLLNTLLGIEEAGKRKEEGVQKGIDVVYLYVNGSVPGFQEALNEAIEEVEAEYDVAYERDSVRQRHRDNSELLYSLRSLEQYLMTPQWRGYSRVWLLLPSEEHIPHWLNTSHPRLRLVYHRDVFPDKSHLPSFNSRAIESHIFRIPNISERYIYLNDDFFFCCRPLSLDDFMSIQKEVEDKDEGGNNESIESKRTSLNEEVLKTRDVMTMMKSRRTTLKVKTRVYLDEILSAEDDYETYRYNWMRGAIELANRLLNERYGTVRKRNYFRHVPRLMSVKKQHDMHAIWENELQETSRHRIRLPWDVHPLFLYFHYVIEEEKLQLQQQQQSNAMVDDMIEERRDKCSADGWPKVDERIEVVSSLEAVVTTKYISVSGSSLPLALGMLQVLLLKSLSLIKFLCINDDAGGSDSPSLDSHLQTFFLKHLFPEPSSFELFQ